MYRKKMKRKSTGRASSAPPKSALHDVLTIFCPPICNKSDFYCIPGTLALPVPLPGVFKMGNAMLQSGEMHSKPLDPPTHHLQASTMTMTMANCLICQISSILILIHLLPLARLQAPTLSCHRHQLLQLHHQDHDQDHHPWPAQICWPAPARPPCRERSARLRPRREPLSTK